jgi:hypothetical protein
MTGELVAPAYNPRYLGIWDWEDRGLRPAQANRSRTPSPKLIRTKWTGGVGQVVEFLLCKDKPHSPPSPPPKKKREIITTHLPQ